MTNPSSVKLREVSDDAVKSGAINSIAALMALEDALCTAALATQGRPASVRIMTERGLEHAWENAKTEVEAFLKTIQPF